MFDEVAMLFITTPRLAYWLESTVPDGTALPSGNLSKFILRTSVPLSPNNAGFAVGSVVKMALFREPRAVGVISNGVKCFAVWFN